MEASEPSKFKTKEDTFLKEFTEARNLKYSELKLTFRKLQNEDFERGFLDTLSCLTSVGETTKEQYAERFRRLGLADSNNYKIIVCIDEATDKVIASGTVLLELKFIRNLGIWGHIEDVSVHSDYSGKKIGLHMVYILKEICKINLWYKVILDCSHDLAAFYKKNGFNEKGVQMAWYNTDVVEHKSTNYELPATFGDI